MPPSKSVNKSRAVFLDRDGVINKVVTRDGGHFSPTALQDFVWIDGVQSAVQALKKMGLAVFVITNQPDIARQKMKAATLEEMNRRIKGHLPVDEIRVCPHDDGDCCACRKPLPGMITALAEKWHIDLSRSFVIGDSRKDMEAGKRAGCLTILIETEYNQGTNGQFKVSSLKDAVQLIKERCR